MLSLLVLATAVSAIAVRPRGAATVLTNLEAIDASTVTLTDTIVAWDASLLGALGIQSDVTSLEASKRQPKRPLFVSLSALLTRFLFFPQTTVTSATSELETESQADSADSTTILDYVSDTLSPAITAALDALVARQADFDALGLDSLVVSDLETLQTDTDALGAALVTLASADTEADAEAIVASVDEAFATAIAAFS